MKVISYLFVSVLVLVKANCPVGSHNPNACNESPGSTECCGVVLDYRDLCKSNGETGYYYYNPNDNTCGFLGAAREYHCCSETAAAGALIGIIAGSVVGIVACGICCCCFLCWHQSIILFGPGKTFTGRKNPARGASQELTPVQQGLPYAPQQIQQAVAVPQPMAMQEQVNVNIPAGGRFDPNTGAPRPKFDPQTGNQNW